MAERGDERSPWAYHPPADIKADEFEVWVANVFAAAEPGLDELNVALRETVAGLDGEYEFDATVRYKWAGLEFLVIVEAKRHKNPIKRELVQALHSKVQSVGAHKGVMVSTAPFQKGAIRFAKAHGIALVSLTEGRFSYLSRAFYPPPILSREEADLRLGPATVIGYCYSRGDSKDSIAMTIISSEFPEYVRELLLGIPKV